MPGEDSDDVPELGEIFKQRYFDYLYNARSMMIDEYTPGDELNILIHTYRRVDCDRNLWDLVHRRDDGSEVILDTVDVDNWHSANTLMNDLATKAGVELYEDDEESIDPAEAMGESDPELRYID